MFTGGDYLCIEFNWLAIPVGLGILIWIGFFLNFAVHSLHFLFGRALRCEESVCRHRKENLLSVLTYIKAIILFDVLPFCAGSKNTENHPGRIDKIISFIFSLSFWLCSIFYLAKLFS